MSIKEKGYIKEGGGVMDAAITIFVRYMKEKYDIEIGEIELVWEGITMYQDEFDPDLFSVENKELTRFTSVLDRNYVDKEEQEWIFLHCGRQ